MKSGFLTPSMIMKSACISPLFYFDCCNLFLLTPFTLIASKINMTELQCPFSTVCPGHLFVLARSWASCLSSFMHNKLYFSHIQCCNAKKGELQNLSFSLFFPTFRCISWRRQCWHAVKGCHLRQSSVINSKAALGTGVISPPFQSAKSNHWSLLLASRQENYWCCCMSWNYCYSSNCVSCR